MPEGDALAHVGDWARQGLIVGFDPNAAGTPLVVVRAALHPTEGAATLILEGYGEDADVLVWWELRASGRNVEAGEPG